MAGSRDISAAVANMAFLFTVFTSSREFTGHLNQVMPIPGEMPTGLFARGDLVVTGISPSNSYFPGFAWPGYLLTGTRN